MIIPVILSGGAGTRLWPVSREGHPKPFMKLSDGESLLQKTYRRAAAVIDFIDGVNGEILTVTNRDYYFMSKDELARARLPTGYFASFLLEPFGRNTAPAVTLSAHQISEQHGPDTLMLVLAADHLIQDENQFVSRVKDAVDLAMKDKLVTFGIVPTGPETGFGYIESGESLAKGRRVLRFVEKPSVDKAREYIATNNFYWNSGIFCFKTGTILEQINLLAPEVASAIQLCWTTTKNKFSPKDSIFEI